MRMKPDLESLISVPTQCSYTMPHAMGRKRQLQIAFTVESFPTQYTNKMMPVVYFYDAPVREIIVCV